MYVRHVVDSWCQKGNISFYAGDKTRQRQLEKDYIHSNINKSYTNRKRRVQRRKLENFQPRKIATAEDIWKNQYLTRQTIQGAKLNWRNNH